MVNALYKITATTTHCNIDTGIGVVLFTEHNTLKLQNFTPIHKKFHRL